MHPVYVWEAHTFIQLTMIVCQSNTTKNHSLFTSHKHKHPQRVISTSHGSNATVTQDLHTDKWFPLSAKHQPVRSPNLAIAGNWPGPFCVQCCGRQFPRGHCSWVSACWVYTHGRIECKVASLVTMWGQTVTGEGKLARAWAGPGSRVTFPTPLVLKAQGLSGWRRRKPTACGSNHFHIGLCINSSPAEVIVKALIKKTFIKILPAAFLRM